MANFVQVMKDWKRMCNAMGQDDEYNACEKCKLGIFSCPAIYEEECEGMNWKHVEEVVAAWAAEHPEPVYPTWEDWLLDIGVIRKGMSWCDLNIPLRQPIPADIARKLGIEPKEDV